MAIIDQLDTPQIKENLLAPDKGMSNDREPFLLLPNQAASLLNANISIAGARQKTPGLWPTGIPATCGTLSPTMFYAVPKASATDTCYVYAKYGNALFRNDCSPLSWTTIIDGVSVSLTDTLYQPAYVSGYLFMTACTPATDADSSIYSSLVRIVTSTSAVTEFTSANARACLGYLNRLWWLDGGGNRLYWSSRYAATYNANSLTFQDSDRGVALTSLRDPTPRLLIWRESSVWLLDLYWAEDSGTVGYDINAVSNSLDFTKAMIRPIVEGVGAVAARAVTWAPGAPGGGDYFFLSNDGIRSLRRSTSDVQSGAGLPISRRIQATIDRINWKHANRACAASYKGVVYFAVPVDDAFNPNLVIAYDSNNDVFYTHDWHVNAFTQIQYPSKDYRLYFLSGTSATETYSGPTTRVGYHIYQTNCAASDYGSGLTGLGGNPIQYEEITRAVIADIEQPPNSTRVKKRWEHTELHLKSGATNATLSLSYRIDDNDSWTFLTYINIPSSETQRFRRKYSLRHLSPGYSLQYKLQDTTSFAFWKIINWFTTAYPLNPTFE